MSPAARLGDATSHGGAIGPAVTGAAARVHIGDRPAACMGDPHTCPASEGPKSHVGGTIATGSASVQIGDRPAARVGDTTACTGAAGQIVVGSPNVQIGP